MSCPPAVSVDGGRDRGTSATRPCGSREGLSSKEIIAHASLLLDASERLTIATGIANMGSHAVALANAARLLADDHPGRFVLASARAFPLTEVRGSRYERPWSGMRAYLDAMDDAPSSGPSRRARRRVSWPPSPRMLELAAERTAGAHTYFVPVEYTGAARRSLGAEPLLAVEQTVVLESDLRPRAPSRPRFAADYLELPTTRTTSPAGLR